MRKLSTRYPNLYLVVTGKGKLREKLKQYIAEIGLESKIKFLECSSEEFLDVLDLLIMPSQSEGFGFLVIEAFTKGVAVVGFNTGGIAEIIEDRKNGLLFERYESSCLEKAIEEIINNKQLGNQLVENAKKDVSRFNLKNMAQATETVYLKALEKKKTE
ncbi:MAG: glycosyltransferase family 4 protein [Candidatus Omnitrophota bacterium]|nr:MAG: glycosyltransferase family 4 protein [Candidatus Omnitrophota bacterium]